MTGAIGSEGSRAIDVAVARAVADAEQCEPTDLKPLYEVVDPGAVEALLESPFDGTIQFTYHGHEVVVDGDGEVVVSTGVTDEAAGKRRVAGDAR